MIKLVFSIIHKSSVFIIVLVLFFSAVTWHNAESALLYKDYVIRYDRGWDILCDPYTVQRDDWVLKIFRQKGEIAHSDFRDFMGIFKRLNPHIKNIDRIRPGQVIDIPLKKLKQGALPGQSSGIVTIPFVTLKNTKDLIKNNSSLYTIKKGDTIYELISQRFGGYGTAEYRRGVKLLKAVNPRISDINKIYAGKNIYMPDPSIRKQSWYESLFDASGNIKNQIGKDEDKPLPPPAVHEPEPKPDETAASYGPIAEAASAIGGTFINKGTYFFPMKQGKTFELDMSRYPVIELKGGPNIILTKEDKVMGRDTALLQSLWEDVKIATIPKDPTTSQVLESVFSAFESGASDQYLSFTDDPMEISIQARWIKTEQLQGDTTPRTICITPVSNPSQQTSMSIKRYLDQNGILLNEFSSGNTSAPDSDKAFKISGVPHFISADSQKALVEKLAGVMGFGYSKNVSISFPYAGIQVKALSNLLSFGPGGECLVDFGDLYGDAIEAVKKTGLQTIQIHKKDTETHIIEKLVALSGKAMSRDPVFFGAQRPGKYNTTIRINGVLVEQDVDDKMLFIETEINPLIVSFLGESNIRVIILKVFSDV